MDSSIFMDKATIPCDADVKSVLGKTYPLWQEIRRIVSEKIPGAAGEWNFPGEKYGWSMRIKNRKRVILYLLPRKHFFMVAFVFGNRAYEQVMGSPVSAEIKKSLETARVYAEGRGTRIAVTGKEVLDDISRLIDIKSAF